jgi:uncharacterized Fe-S cluster protein YjdI
VPKKDYVQRLDGAPVLTVHWDSERCIHSRHCVTGLPEVFDFDARPWIRVDEASADRIAEQVDRCPSGALGYTRFDGGPLGPGARSEQPGPASDDGGSDDVAVTVRVTAGGPLSVRGPVQVVDDAGAVLRVTSRVALCRCGASGDKPFCDGSHMRVGFSG